MQHHRKFQMISNGISQSEHYGHRLRMAKFHQPQQLKYQQYLSGGSALDSMPNHQRMQENESSEQSFEQQFIQEDQQLAGQSQFDIAGYISTLSKKDREIFKKENSQLPAIMFMTKKQKKKYFQQINDNFQTSLHKTKSRISKNKKIIKFKNDFQVKTFSHKKNVKSLTKTNQFRETYHKHIHFS